MIRSLSFAFAAVALLMSSGPGQGRLAPEATVSPPPIPWTLRLNPSSGHTGRVHLEPEGQLHEGPGHTGVASAAYHYHALDRSTGMLDPVGQALDAELRPLKPRPSARERLLRAVEEGAQRAPTPRALVDRLRESLCALPAARTSPAANEELPWAALDTRIRAVLARVSPPEAATSLHTREIRAAYLDVLEERLAALREFRDVTGVVGPEAASRAALVSARRRTLARAAREAKALERALLAPAAVATRQRHWSETVPPAALRAFVSMDWAACLREFASRPESVLSPTSRHLLGHAMLAQNRNQQAYDLFASASDGESIAAWQDFGIRLASADPSCVAAMFIQADGVARAGHFDRAERLFTAVIERGPRQRLSRGAVGLDTMARNARAVVLCQSGREDDAFNDLMDVTESTPGFADAHGNLAAWALLRSDGVGGGLAAVGRALKLAPHCGWFRLSCASLMAVSWRRIAEARSALRSIGGGPDLEPSIAAESNLSRLMALELEAMVGREDVASAAPGSFVEKVKGFSGAVSDGFRMAGNQAASAFNRYGSRKAITESRYTETTIGGVAVGAGPFKSIGGFIQKKTTPESRKAALKAELEFRGSYQSDHLTPQMNEINRSFNRNAARMLNPGGVSTAPPANPLDGKPWQLRTEFCLRYRSLGDFIVKRGVRKEK